MLANLVIAGEQGGSVTGLSPATARDAAADLERTYNLNGVDRPIPYGWHIFVLNAWLLLAKEPAGAAEDCELLHRQYVMVLEGFDAPKKRGRPTMHSGRHGRSAPGGKRTAGTKLDRAARRTRDPGGGF